MKFGDTTLVGSLDRDGAAMSAAVLRQAEVAALAAELEPYFRKGPGARLFGHNSVAALAGPVGALGRLAMEVLGPKARAVRALAFDKTQDANWTVGWHQDRTIAVRARIEMPDFGPWSVKEGVPHVEPPFAIMAGMITMRLHLDDCGADNAPLRIAMGSHRLERATAQQAASLAGRCEELICLAEAGDVWVYRTPVLHASKPSADAGRRRVLQLDFSAQDLPGGLEWAGIA
jgi:hypothetical protein